MKAIDVTERKMIHRGIVSVPHSMIATFLCFPPDADVLGAYYDVNTGNWDVIVRHDSLPERKEGKRYVNVKPCYKTEERDGELWVCFERFEVEEENNG